MLATMAWVEVREARWEWRKAARAHLVRTCLRLLSLLLLLGLIAVQLTVRDAATRQLLSRAAILALAIFSTASVVGDYVYGRERRQARLLRSGSTSGTQRRVA